MLSTETPGARPYAVLRRKGGIAPQSTCYFAQQSLQQAEPGWQQLAPQQDPQLEPGVQTVSPVSASADRDESDRTRTANSLNFIGFSSRLHKWKERALEGAGVRSGHTERSRFSDRLSIERQAASSRGPRSAPAQKHAPQDPGRWRAPGSRLSAAPEPCVSAALSGLPQPDRAPAHNCCFGCRSAGSTASAAGSERASRRRSPQSGA